MDNVHGHNMLLTFLSVFREIWTLLTINRDQLNKFTSGNIMHHWQWMSNIRNQTVCVRKRHRELYSQTIGFDYRDASDINTTVESGTLW